MTTVDLLVLGWMIGGAWFISAIGADDDDDFPGGGETAA